MLKLTELRKYDILKDTKTSRLYCYLQKSEMYRNHVVISGVEPDRLESGSISLKDLEHENSIEISDWIRILEYADKLINIEESHYVYFNRIVIVDGKLKIEVTDLPNSQNRVIIDIDKVLKSTNTGSYLDEYEERLLLILREGKMHGVNVDIANGKARFKLENLEHTYFI